MTISLNHFKTGLVRNTALASSITGTLIAIGFQYDLEKSEWASWVQAIGSITALGVAIFVMSRQNAHSTRMVANADRLATLRRAHSVRALAVRAIVTFQQTRIFTERRGATPHDVAQHEIDLRISTDRVDDLLKTLKSIPTYDLGSFEIVSGVHQIIDSYTTYLWVLTQYSSDLSVPVSSDNKTPNDQTNGLILGGLNLIEKGMRDLMQQ